MTKRTRILTMLLATSLCSSFSVRGQGAPPLRRVDLRLDSLADSGAYLVYSYRIVNARESRGGTAVLSLDVSAPRGTGFPTLPATGRFDHGAGYPGVVLTRFRDHVPVGPISPTNWKAFLTKDATLDWYGAHGGFEGDIDSIAPGDSLKGFALRSPYLPGVRALWAAPTFRSCCARVRPGSDASEPENPNPSEFKILGWSVGPTYAPGTVTLDVMAALLTRVCGELAWVEGAQVCHSLRAKLNQAVQVRGDRDGSSRALLALLEELEAQHGPGKPVNDNAYWLLKANGEYLLAHM